MGYPITPYGIDMITMFSAEPLMISLSISDDDYDVLKSFYTIFCFIFG